MLTSSRSGPVVHASSRKVTRYLPRRLSSSENSPGSGGEDFPQALSLYPPNALSLVAHWSILMRLLFVAGVRGQEEFRRLKCASFLRGIVQAGRELQGRALGRPLAVYRSDLAARGQGLPPGYQQTRGRIFSATTTTLEQPGGSGRDL